MELWQIFGLIAVMTMLSFRWGYTKGKLEMIEAMLEVAAEEEERRGISND